MTHLTPQQEIERDGRDWADYVFIGGRPVYRPLPYEPTRADLRREADLDAACEAALDDEEEDDEE